MSATLPPNHGIPLVTVGSEGNRKGRLDLKRPRLRFNQVGRLRRTARPFPLQYFPKCGFVENANTELLRLIEFVAASPAA